MNKPARNKPAVLKISRGSATSIGPLRTQGPFTKAKKPLPTARTSTNRGILQNRGLLPKVSKPECSNPTSTAPGPVQTQVPSPKGNEPVSLNKAFTSPRPVQAPGRKTGIPVSPDQPSTKRDNFQTRGPLPKTRASLSLTGVSKNFRPLQTRVPVPKTKIPVSSRYGNQGSASKNPAPAKTQGSVVSDQAPIGPDPDQTKGKKPVHIPSHIPQNRVITTSNLVQTRQPLSKVNKPVFSGSVQTSGCKTSLPVLSDRSSTGPDPLQTRGPAPKSKIPTFSESKYRGSAPATPNPVQAPGLKANKPIITGRAFGSSLPVQTQGLKAFEPMSSVSRNRGSAFRHPSLVQTQRLALVVGNNLEEKEFLPLNLIIFYNSQARAPTSSDILRNRQPLSKASESVSLGVRKRASLSTSPSYIRKSKILVHSDRSFTSSHRLQARGPKATLPLQTKGLPPKSSEPVSSTNRNQRSAVTSANKNLNFASRTPGILRTPRSRSTSPGRHARIVFDPALDEKPNRNTEQSLKGLPSASQDRKSDLATRNNEVNLADELERRNRFISELEMKLVENQNLVSEQALCLAEIKADQKAKDLAMEQLKSELLTAKAEYNRMHSRLKEADLGLERATCKVNNYLERSTSLESEIKEDVILNLDRLLKDADAKAKIHCQTKAQLSQDVESLQEQVALDSKRIHNLEQSEADLRGDLEKRDRLINQVDRRLIPMIVLPGLILLLLLRR
ncbi:hypothetical protein KR054_001308 [Drosophila jambulina]|nr:hypothetical protein KR054_001308 [Drosophila jambulina]